MSWVFIIVVLALTTTIIWVYNRLVRQRNIVHSACPATATETALLTTERQQFFIVAGFAPDP